MEANLNLDQELSVAPPSNAVFEAPSTLNEKQRFEVCRAAIAELNGREKASIKKVSDSGVSVRVSYVRPDDGKKWTNECRFDASKVVWRTVDAFEKGSGLGRWRDGPSDETITYKVSGDDVSVNVAY